MRYRIAEIRFKQDLRRDEFIPIAVIAAKRYSDGMNVVMVCVANPQLPDRDDFVRLISQNLPSYVSQMAREVLAKQEIKPDDDILELIRTRNRYNFHASVPEDYDSDAAEGYDFKNSNLEAVAKNLFAQRVVKHKHYSGRARVESVIFHF